ncbi:MAG TPA: lipase family protein [Blastocatellia bacterium]|nr:lipase family protein [Blastocatellia bacterium]
MLKPIPAADYNSIVPPNENYEYFWRSSEHPFALRPGSFAWSNAAWCADAALLAYFDKNRIEQKSRHVGFAKLTVLSEGNTQCFIAQTEQFAIVAFRGTTLLKPGVNLRWSDLRGSADATLDAFLDVLTDANIVPREDVHSGFQEALDLVWSKLQAEFPPVPIWFTGHSLGGALAVLAADRQQKQNGRVGGVYTFGCPVIGGQRFQNNFALTDRTFRFVNNNDWLPKLEAVYQHIGQVRYITRQGEMSHEISRQDQIEGALTHGLNVVKNWARLKSNLIPSDSLCDHAPIYYATHLWNYYVQHL